jgi:NAD(P)-dependent dehydrogenase (short-subunit alcohol dehydrogenase family)
LFAFSHIPSAARDRAAAAIPRRVLAIASEPAAEASCQALSEAGFTVDVLRAPELASAGVETIVGRLRGADILLYLDNAGLVENSIGSGREFERAASRLFFVFQRLADPLRRAPLSIVLPVAMDGAFGAQYVSNVRPFGSFPAGFARALADEWPLCHVQIIDLGTGAWPERLPGALRNLTGEREQGAGRLILTDARPGGGFSMPVSAGECVFVTGGARGITFECAFALARQTGCRLMLTGRTALNADPPSWLSCGTGEVDRVLRELEMSWVRHEGVNLGEARRRSRTARAQWEVQHNLDRCAKAGVDVEYTPADLRQPSEVVRAMTLASGRDPIRAVIHGAGVQRSARIEELSDAEIRATIATKLIPVITMASALDWRAVRSVVAFGSVSGLVGNAGQTHYALANDSMASLLRALGERHPHVRMQTIHWTGWNGAGMVTQTQARRFEASGLAMLDVEDGVRLFLDAVARCSHFPELAALHSDREIAPHRPIGAPRRREALLDGEQAAFPKTAVFSLSTDDYLTQHLVEGQPVVPGTFVAELMAEAFGAAVPALESVTFRRPLRVRSEPFEIALLLQNGRISVVPANPGRVPEAARHQLEFASARAGASGESGHWGRFEPELVTALHSATGDTHADFYRGVGERHARTLLSGPIFHGVQATLAHDRLFCGCVRLPDAALRRFHETGRFRFHPVLADLAVQVAAARGVLEDGVLAVPKSIDRLVMPAARGVREAIVICQRVEHSTERSKHHVSVWSRDGEPLLLLEGLSLQTLAAPPRS